MGSVYKRIVLKLSGEALQGRKSHGIDQSVLVSIARQIKEIRESHVDVAIVLGGGNIFRGQENVGARGLDMDRSVADYKWYSGGAGANFLIIPGKAPMIMEGNFAYSLYNISFL